MPSSTHKPTSTTSSRARSTSTGPTRRGPQKAHIPFRADDLEHGKKTGIEVAYVAHNSDEFEPFSEIMGQADGRTPVGVGRSGRKSGRGKEQEDGDEDEDGEMSMELDQSAASPLAYFTNTQNHNRTRNHPSSPLASTRVLGQSSSRPIARSSEVDFDSVPSPRSSRVRQNGTGAGPSNLSRSSVVYDGADDVDDGVPGGFDGYGPPEDDVSPNSNSKSHSHSRSQAQSTSESQRTPRKTNFSALAHSDSEEEVEQATSRDPPPQSSARKANARIRRSSPSPPVPASDDFPHDQQQQGQEQEYEPQDPQDVDMDQDMDKGQDYEVGVEDDIARGLDDVELGGSGEAGEGEGEDQEERPKKKGRMTKGKENAKGSKGEKQGKKTGNAKRERKMVEIPRDASPPPGVRRGLRHRYRPLDWWRQERVVYGRRESGISFVPHIKEIIRIPQDPPQQLGKHAQGKRKRSATAGARGKSESRGADDKALLAAAAAAAGNVYNPEEGWDADTDPTGVVLDYVTKEEVSRRIAYTANMIDPKPAANNDWYFQKVFGDGEFIAAGQLLIPPKGRKPSKGTKDNTYVFYVIEGAVNFKVHDTTLVLATGAMFLVPRGNTYFIENIGDRDAKLFFTQARKIALEEEEGENVISAPRRSNESMPRKVSGGSGGRSSSAAAPSGGGGAGVVEKVRRAMSTRG